MKPCTSYTYQVQRVPYTTYRPVYRQETYKVPVTTITNDCSTGACNTCDTGTSATGTFETGCNTCGTPGLSQQPNYAPTPAPQTSTYYESAPGPVSNGGGFTPSPADQTPSLINPTSYPRPVTDRLITPIGSGYQTSNEPAKINIQQTASRSPIREQWSYSPVRLASYEKPATTPVRLAPAMRQMTSLSQVQAPAARSQPAKRNGWVEVN